MATVGTSFGPHARVWTGHFNEGPGYGVHRPAGCPDWLLIATVDGRGAFRHSRGDLTAEPGTFVLIEPDTPHGYWTDQDYGHWELRWVHVVPDLDWLDFLRWPEPAPGFHILTLDDPEAAGRVMHDLAEAHHLMSGFARHRERLALARIESALLWCDERNPLGRTPVIDPRVRLAMETLAREHDQPFSLARLGKVCRLSPSRAAHLFREQAGVSPQRFHELHRIHHARQLLDMTNRTIAEIADAVGYHSPFYFSRRFKLLAGTSPSEYRRRTAHTN